MSTPTVIAHIEATDLNTADPHLIYVDRRDDAAVLLHLDKQGVPDWEDLTQADVDHHTGHMDDRLARWLLTRFIVGQFGDRVIALTDGEAADLADMLRTGS